MPTHFDLTDAPDEAELEIIETGLQAFNAVDVGPSGKKTLVIFVRDDSGEVEGGLYGYTAWGWLYVQWLWLAEHRRGQGLAGQLLERAEREAIARGCGGAFIDTFNPKALKAYQKAGYVAFGELPEFPPGRKRTFLQKSLRASA